MWLDAMRHEADSTLGSPPLPPILASHRQWPLGPAAIVVTVPGRGTAADVPSGHFMLIAGIDAGDMHARPAATEDIHPS